MKFTKDSQDDILSNLGEGVELVGDLSFTHGLRVDGTFKGKIKSESLLAVGPKGKVEAEVASRKITINGEFRGTIRAGERVEIHREGRVYGDIYTPCLIIEAGAIFEGKCNMSERKVARGDEGAMLKIVDAGSEAGKGAHHAVSSAKS